MHSSGSISWGLASVWWCPNYDSLYLLYMAQSSARPVLASSRGSLRAARKGKHHGEGTFQVLVFIALDNILLFTTCQLAKSRVRKGPQKSVDRGGAIGGHCCDPLSPNPKQIPMSALSVPTGFSGIKPLSSLTLRL